MNSVPKTKDVGPNPAANENKSRMPRANWASRAILAAALGCAGAGCASTRAAAPELKEPIRLEETCIEGKTHITEKVIGAHIRVLKPSSTLSQMAEKTKNPENFFFERFSEITGENSAKETYEKSVEIENFAHVRIRIETYAGQNFGNLYFEPIGSANSRTVTFDLADLIHIFEAATGQKLARAEALVDFIADKGECDNGYYFPGYQIFVIPSDKGGKLLPYKDGEYLGLHIYATENQIQGGLVLIKEPLQTESK